MVVIVDLQGASTLFNVCLEYETNNLLYVDSQKHISKKSNPKTLNHAGDT